MVGWLAIPYLGINKAGREEVWSIRFRCTEDHDCKEHGHGKYQTLPGDASRMFNTRALKTAGNEISCSEGEGDCIILNQCGIPAVGIPGANNWRPHHARMLDGFSRVFIWGDPDQAGQDFSQRVAKSLGRSASIVHMEAGDVNETFLAQGEEGLHKLLEETR